MKELKSTRIVFINNFCTHFTVKMFEELSLLLSVRFLFFSDGGERYWETANEKHTGKFEFRYLPGFYLTSKLRIVPSLASELLCGKYDAVIMCLAGRFALPASFLLAKIRRKPFILWTGLWYHPESFFHKLSWPLMRFIYRHSDAILVYGLHVKKYLIEQGVHDKKIFPFWHSVDTEKLGRDTDQNQINDYRKKWAPQGESIILYVGRLDPVKSLETLIEACSRFKNDAPQLVIVGRGPELGFLKSFAQMMGISVTFEDYVPNPLLPEVYAASDVFCLPSKTLPTVKEAWGLVVNEAMLQRCIPVTSDAVGAAVGGLFTEEMSPLIFKECDVDDLKRALITALDWSKQTEKKEAVHERALRFSPKRQALGAIDALNYIGVTQVDSELRKILDQSQSS